MSVLIRGIEMPKSCNACMFNVYGLCLINKNIEGKDELTHSCPLVPVPPHGRLIDADALKYTMLYKENWMSGTGVEAPAIWRKDIDAAPTIIPAEEGE